MGDSSKIEWTEATWNPVVGCSKVSPGCAHCYAEALSLRHGWTPSPWTPENAAENVILKSERLDQPLRWTKPRMIFVNSMSDLFHELIPFEYVESIFRVMAEARQHTFQVLTKRPEVALDVVRRIYDRSEDVLGSGYMGASWPPLPNVWLGVSIENARYTWRADVLREIPAAVRFISAEPLIGSLLSSAPADGVPSGSNDAPARGRDSETGDDAAQANRDPVQVRRRARSSLDLTGIDWLIVGGESGGRLARPMHPEWARELRDACLSERWDLAPPAPAFFFKQWGSHDENGVYRGASPKSGGRLLDGREWNEMPSVAPPGVLFAA